MEGGALICHDEKTKKRIDYLKNFGFAGETEIVAPGINGKMDEVRAAFGLLNLKQVDVAIEAVVKWLFVIVMLCGKCPASVLWKICLVYVTTTLIFQYLWMPRNMA